MLNVDFHAFSSPAKQEASRSKESIFKPHTSLSGAGKAVLTFRPDRKRRLESQTCQDNRRHSDSRVTCRENRGTLRYKQFGLPLAVRCTKGRRYYTFLQTLRYLTSYNDLLACIHGELYYVRTYLNCNVYAQDIHKLYIAMAGDGGEAKRTRRACDNCRSVLHEFLSLC